MAELTTELTELPELPELPELGAETTGELFLAMAETVEKLQSVAGKAGIDSRTFRILATDASGIMQAIIRLANSVEGPNYSDSLDKRDERR